MFLKDYSRGWFKENYHLCFKKVSFCLFVSSWLPQWYIVCFESFQLLEKISYGVGILSSTPISIYWLRKHTKFSNQKVLFLFLESTLVRNWRMTINLPKKMTSYPVIVDQKNVADIWINYFYKFVSVCFYSKKRICLDNNY